MNKGLWEQRERGGGEGGEEGRKGGRVSPTGGGDSHEQAGE